jgi:type I restriction enzyme S subunit
MVPLGDVMARVDDLIPIRADESYREVTVRLWGKGVTLRRECLGVEIKSDRRTRVRAGQFIASRIDARNGAFGVIPSELDGAVVTNDFPTFSARSDRLDNSFLNWMSKTATFVDLCKAASEGTTNRVRLKEDRFLATPISLPPIGEQRRIVARIEALAAKIAEARGLREESEKTVAALRQSTAHYLFDSAEIRRWPVRSLGEIAEIRSGVTLGRDLRGGQISLPYLRVANVQDGHLDLSRIKHVTILESEADKWRLRRGDLLLTEGGDWDKLGRGTLWNDEIPNCIHQNHIFRLRSKPEEFNPRFLAIMVSSPYAKRYFQDASKRTTNLASINQRQLKALPIFQPPLARQARIVEFLDEISAAGESIKDRQSATAAELTALLPSVLDKAFKGEL